ncbi:O-antigen ligase family protein [Candidatus Amesbacteria bacterium]|nr:O-antigen ligase family protein [Candidatus Amesbacteria bacterium]
MEKYKWWLLLLLLFVVPLYPKFPLVGIGGTFVSIRIEDFVIGLVLVGWLIGNWKDKFEGPKTPIGKAILVYWAVGLVSVFAGILLTKTSSLNLGLLHYLRRIEYMSMYFVGYWAISNIKQLGSLVKMIVLVGFVVAIYGLGQQFLAWPIISTTNSEFAKGLALSLGAGARINSTFAGHYDLAAFSLFPLLIILSTLITNKKNNWLYWIIGSLVYWVMLLSASRITFASLIIVSSIFLVRFKKWWGLVLLGIISVISVFLSPQLAGRYFNLISVARAEEKVIQNVNTVPDALKPTEVLEDRSLNIRLKASWPKALRALAKNPILGTGYSSVGLAVDNDYLRVLAETGILGLASFGLVFLRLFKSWISSKSPFVWAILCVTGGLLLNAVFIDIFEASKIATIFWLLAGVTQKFRELV